MTTNKITRRPVNQQRLMTLSTRLQSIACYADGVTLEFRSTSDAHLYSVQLTERTLRQAVEMLDSQQAQEVPQAAASEPEPPSSSQGAPRLPAHSPSPPAAHAASETDHDGEQDDDVIDADFELAPRRAR